MVNVEGRNAPFGVKLIVLYYNILSFLLILNGIAFLVSLKFESILFKIGLGIGGIIMGLFAGGLIIQYTHYFISLTPFSNLYLDGLIYLFFGILFFLCSYSLWKRKNFFRILIIIFSVINLILFLRFIYYPVYYIPILLTFIINISIVIYLLFNKKVKEYFLN